MKSSAALPDASALPGLNDIIAPEVHRDEFSDAIRNLARWAAIDTVLEIGSSSGEGSTKAWVEGLRSNPRKPRLFCMEVSKVRCEALRERWNPEGFVECFLGSSVDVDQFPSAEEVRKFHSTVPGPLQKYPLEQVLGWLRADLDYIRDESVPTGMIREIKKARGIENFGAVLIDGSEFTGNVELDEVYGAEYILLDDTQTFKCHEAHLRLLHDPAYELIAENPKLRHGYSIFRRRRKTVLDPLAEDAPVHFFTIVLNGEPFIRHHIEVFRELSFPWHWHIVEGIATLSHDTAWSRENGGRLPEDLHRSGLSVDGTSEYLDELAREFPDNVTIHRTQGGVPWDGKIEMVSEPVKHIYSDGILWEVDSDELWTVEQLEAGRRMFLRSPEKMAAWFWCDFFVGERLVISTRNGYAQNPEQEWRRAWRFRPGMKWLSHEPPVLAERLSDGSWRDVGRGRIFTHAETEADGLVFQHYAYATEGQVAFKEQYYGYAGAVDAWRRLQAADRFPALLRETLSWVKDRTLVNTVENCGVVPLATRDRSSGEWRFVTHGIGRGSDGYSAGTIVVDGVFFQFNNTGIGRVWRETLRQWAASGVVGRVVLLDRDGTAPEFAGVRRRLIDRYDPARPGDDALMLQHVCDELHASVFVSSYYTAPIRTPSVAMIYDMIPELLGEDREGWAWKQKALAIRHSERVVCISRSTADDVLRLHPEVAADDVVVMQLAASPELGPVDFDSIADFRRRHGVGNDYLLVAGERVGVHVGTQGYKNAALIFRAWSLLPAEERRSLSIVCAGGRPELEDELRILAPDAEVIIVRFSEEDLRIAYAGAVALGYPSLYEGFGLPVIEAMACGCPVITCRRASLTEVAGDAAIFVDPWAPAEAADAILALRYDAAVRARIVEAGLRQAAGFSYERAAAQLATILDEVGRKSAAHGSLKRALLWEDVRREQQVRARLQEERIDAAAQIRDLKKVVKRTEKELAKAKKRLAEAKERRRAPLQRLWDRLRGKSKKR